MIALFRTLLGLGVGWILARLTALLGRLSAGREPPARVAARRAFVRNAALSSVGAALAVVGAGFGALMWPNKTGAFGSVVTVRSADVPDVYGPPFRHTAGHFFLAHNPDGLLAMWWKCPHLGCTVPWVGPPDSPHAYQCPCHGSMYDYNGDRTGGPAPRPLDLMAVRIEGDSVQVDTGAISTAPATRGARRPRSRRSAAEWRRGKRAPARGRERIDPAGRINTRSRPAATPQEIAANLAALLDLPTDRLLSAERRMTAW